MPVLYIFNPEHDLALANGSPFFNPPRSAKQFATDCCGLFTHLFDDGVMIDGAKNFCCDILKDINLSVIDIDKIVPWGWNVSLVNILQKAELDNRLLPTETQLEDIRQLSNRATAVGVLSYLKQKQVLSVELPSVLETVSEAIDFAKQMDRVVFKMPWSGSGKGIRICKQTLTDNDIKWLQNVMDKQHTVIGERYNDVVCNFAMEFCADDDVRFVGYSLFDTCNGRYVGNRLMSDRSIEDYLAQWIDVDNIHVYKNEIMDYMSRLLVGKYKGYFGVDMYVYDADKGYKLYPIVEINFRLTMGLACLVLKKVDTKVNKNA